MADRIIKPDSGNQLVLQDEGGSDAIRIDTSGRVGLGVTPADKLHVNGNIRLVSPYGINFSAYATSGNPSSNLLDDYEEGTFTPAVEGTTSAGTGVGYSQTGSYTKVGRLVYVNIRISWTDHDGTGNLRLTGLPFTHESTKFAYLGFNFRDGLTVSALNTAHLSVTPSTTKANFYQTPTGTGTTTLIAMDTAVTDLSISGVYSTS